MTAIFEDRALAGKAAKKLRVYAQPQRLMILSCLLRGERTVGEIEAATGIAQPALSQQLAELRRAEMVKTRKVAKQVHYDLADDDIGLCVRSMEAIFGSGRAVEDKLKAVMAPIRSSAVPAEERAGAAVFGRIG